MQPIIEVKNLTYSYDDGTKALKEISFQINKGSKTVVLGPNGAGKTTLMFHLNALIFPQEGELKIANQYINEKNKAWIRENVGLIMQDPDDQVFCPTVYEDIAFGLTNFNRVPQDEVDKAIEKVLKKLNIFNLRDKAPYKLSYGQKKKVAIAGVLAVDPEIMVFDEPLAALDPAGKDNLISILNKLHEAGKTLIIVSHDIDFAAQWAENLLILKDGKLLAQGKRELLQNKSLLTRANLSLSTASQIVCDFPELNSSPLPLNTKEAQARIHEYINKK
ncbi:ATP-binding cassette domain-containing protein [Halanaerobium sp. Z-7514]|uniref:ATP-binding cassette domain-containing protein n=1 Tax=Halanaerobium polyolivorans TaxID=2886943 RepID=A0AAW4X105_9FIRM|nr:ATP-binding cassette domain-containing protein [Halanaerobium polyolivorans]MCC3145494.1 ATP-binding cassette domain-containing protein [Halanaerobium polyolivorans]